MERFFGHMNVSYYVLSRHVVNQSLGEILPTRPLTFYTSHTKTVNREIFFLMEGGGMYLTSPLAVLGYQSVFRTMKHLI